LADVFEWPVPPGQAGQAMNVVLGVPAADEPGRVAAGDRVVGDVVDDDRACRDDRSVSDVDAGHHDGLVPDPDVVAHDGVAATGQAGDEVEVFGPGAAHDGKGKGRGTVHAVVRSVHDEADALGKGAELPDDQFFRSVVVEHVSGL